MHRYTMYNENDFFNHAKAVVRLQINKELLKGSTGMMILNLLAHKDCYGYQLMKELQQISDGVFHLKEGTLYPILHGLESKQWVESYWDAMDGRKRKYYRITKKGRSELQAKKKEWKLFRNALDRVLGEEPV